MTTRILSYFFSASVLSLAFLSAANCGGDGTGTSVISSNSSSSSGSSSSSSSSGAGGSGTDSCVKDSDCMQPNRVCEQNKCITATCVNGTKDTGESDVDCGGAGCLPCANGKMCTMAEDCGTKFCNGAGGVGGAGSMMCADCVAEADCMGAPDSYCNGGTCTPKKAGAAACALDAECQSGFCPPQDGMCCDARCDNDCESCAGEKTGGVDGACAPVKADSDPDAECTDKGSTSCGANGTGCNGDNTAPGCKLYGNTTPCAAASCTAGQATADSLCDGLGLCVAPAAMSCAPYSCDGMAINCLTKCTTNAQCANTHFCDTVTSLCALKKTNGNTCSSGAQCASGFCPGQDGVCCDTACDTTCRACLQTKTGAASGTCANVTNGKDPDNECSMILAPNCNGAGQCG